MAKRIISLFLSVLLLVTMLPVSALPVKAEEKSPDASGTINENISYTFDPGAGTLTLSGTGEIPDYGNSGNYAPFKNCTTVRHIVIEEGITGIGTYVFYLMEGVESVSLPASVVTISENSFRDSQINKDGFTVAEESESFCAVDGVLFNKDKTKLFRFVDKSLTDYEDYTIPATVQMIMQGAFGEDVTLDTLTLAGDQLVLGNSSITGATVKHLQIEEGVKDLGINGYIDGLEDTQLTIPASVTKISSSGIISDNHIETVTVAEGNETYYDIDGVVVQRQDGCLILYPCGRRNTAYTTPAGVKAIEFWGIRNSYLQELVLSAEVERVSNNFVQGTAVKTITVYNPFLEYPADGNYIYGTDLVRALQNLYAYEYSTTKKYIEGTSTGFTALPECDFHRTVADRRVEPTCTEDGYDVCGVCGTPVYKADLARLGHDYRTQVIEPDCVRTGYTIYTCSRCADSYEADVTPKSSVHKMTNATITYDEDTNEEIRHCEYETTAEIPLNTRLPETEHNYADMADETYTISCRDAKQIRIVFDDKSYTEPGYDQVMFYKDSIAPENLLDTRSGALRNLELTFDTKTLVIHFTSDSSKHYYGFKVAEAYEIYDGCGYTRRSYHVKHKEAIVSQTPATCQAAGETRYQCTVCGKERVAEEAVTDHNYVETESERIQGTCVTEGSAVYICSYCADRKVENTGLGTHEFQDGVCRYCKETHTIGTFSRISVDEFGKLSWNAVENAQVYQIYLRDGADETKAYKPITKDLTVTEYDLSEYLTDGKTYYIGFNAIHPGYDLSVSNDYPGYEFTYHAHKHNYTKTVTGAALGKDGKRIEQCSGCGAVLKEETIPGVAGITVSKTAFTYNGRVQKPAVTVYDSKGTALKEGTDYTVTYAKGCKNVGRYSVIVTLQGVYSGSKTEQFTISPKKISLGKLKAAKKGFKVSWKKQTAQTSGYELQYSTDKRFRKAVKTVTIKKNKITSKSVSKLKAKKKYYVRIRTYKMCGRTKLTSEWSKAKSITTKKK